MKVFFVRKNGLTRPEQEIDLGNKYSYRGKNDDASLFSKLTIAGVIWRIGSIMTIIKLNEERFHS